MWRRVFSRSLAAVAMVIAAAGAHGGSCPGYHTFTPTSLPHVPVNSAYSQSVTVTFYSVPCGGPFYTLLSIIAGSMPPGITHSNTNPMSFTGTPPTVGYYPFTLQSDTGDPTMPPEFADQNYAITVDFLDVPATNAFEPFIMKLVANNITAGCDATHYCPTGLILRSSMAVFIIKSEHGSAYVPPPATGIFADVPASNGFAPWIEEIYHEGITGGCATNPLQYCPGNYVIRAQMAIFLLRAKWGPAYVPPASAQIFADVPPSSPFEPWINEIYNEGIMPGCGGGNFCPSWNVNRVSMSVYLVLMFNLGFPLP